MAKYGFMFSLVGKPGKVVLERGENDHSGPEREAVRAAIDGLNLALDRTTGNLTSDGESLFTVGTEQKTIISPRRVDEATDEIVPQKWGSVPAFSTYKPAEGLYKLSVYKAQGRWFLSVYERPFENAAPAPKLSQDSTDEPV